MPIVLRGAPTGTAPRLTVTVNLTLCPCVQAPGAGYQQVYTVVVVVLVSHRGVCPCVCV